ncbi:MAG TPA: hypothetical protein VMZ69_01550, partial [Saprospiraceae bacterium]|nr:hypothetical protein [Saprospiraceae bacterium]
LFPLDQHDAVALPYLSYFEYEVEYFAIGIPVRLSIHLGNKPNHPYFSFGGIVQQIMSSSGEKFQLIESGLGLHPLQLEQYGFELNKTHVYVQVGTGYEIKLWATRKLSIGPEINYSINNFLNKEDGERGPVYINGNLVFLGLHILYH